MRRPGRRAPRPEGTMSADEPGQLGQGPPVLDRELARSGQLESGTGQYPGIGLALPRQVPAGRDSVPGAERRLPLVQGGGQGLLPAGLAYPWRGRPAQREVSARLEPAVDAAGDQIAVEPVERVADDGQLEVARGGV